MRVAILWMHLLLIYKNVFFFFCCRYADGYFQLKTAWLWAQLWAVSVDHYKPCGAHRLSPPSGFCRHCLGFPWFPGPQTILQEAEDGPGGEAPGEVPGQGYPFLKSLSCQIVLHICWLVFLKYFGKIQIQLRIWFWANSYGQVEFYICGKIKKKSDV